jgi:hypothetical protein
MSFFTMDRKRVLLTNIRNATKEVEVLLTNIRNPTKEVVVHNGLKITVFSSFLNQSSSPFEGLNSLFSFKVISSTF